MIELSPIMAIMIYLGMTLGILLSLWAYSHYQQRHKKLVTSDQTLKMCEYCAFAYLADTSKKISKCPQCLSYNKD